MNLNLPVRIFLFTAVLCMGLCHEMFAQNWVWAQRLGNTRSDKVTCIKTDGLGYIYISGYFSNTTTIGTNAVPLNYTANTNSKEIFLAKFDSTGFCYWAKSGGEYFDDRVLGMDVDSAGYSVITGTFWEGSGINIGPINITGSAFGWGDQCFIARFDPAGNILWGNFACSNSGDDQGLDIATDKKGNSYVAGFMTGSTLYCGGNAVTATNPNTAGSHRHCYFLAKINASGTFQWARTFGNLPWDPDANKYIERDIAVCVDDAGGVYVTGGFDGTRQFGTQTFTTAGGHDIFVMRYDTSGNFSWATKGGSDKDDWSNGICADRGGFLYITGEHRDSLIMDTVLVRNYDKRDVFVFKIDAQTGKPVWGKRAGSDLGGERGNDVWADTNCNVYVVGDINEGAKFGDNITVPTGQMEQSFVARISPDGKWIWVATGGGADSNDRCNAVAKGKGAQLYAAGYFRAPSQFGGSSLSSAGSSDGYFARLHDSMVNRGTPFILEAPDPLDFCKGDTILLDIPKHAYLSISPQTGFTANADTTEIRFSPDSTTTYTISGFSTGSCPEYDTIQFTLTRNPDPIADFDITPDIAMIQDPVFTLNNLSTGATTFEWYHEGSLFSTLLNTTKTFDSAGTYCFLLKAISPQGCWDTVTHCAKIVKEERWFFPNAFSPNGDGRNDLFRPLLFNMDLAEIKDYKMVVANRYGQIVFESDDPAFGWNGTFRGNTDKTEMAVYFYTCRFTTPLGKKIDVKGDVTLVK